MKLLRGHLDILKQHLQKASECNAEGGVKPRACEILKNERIRPPWGETRNDPDIPPEYEGYEQIYKFAPSLCKELEAWLSLFKQGQDESERLYRSNCLQYKRGNFSSSETPGENCLPDRSRQEWDAIARQAKYRTTNSSHVRLQLCAEIVTIIARGFNLNNTAAQVKEEKAEKDNQCQQVYELLRRWATPKVAEEIMSQWFVGDNNGGRGREIFSLSGIDIFEMITAILTQGNYQSKNIFCEIDKTPDGQTPDTPRVYKTKITDWESFNKAVEDVTRIITGESEIWESAAEAVEKRTQECLQWKDGGSHSAVLQNSHCGANGGRGSSADHAVSETVSPTPPSSSGGGAIIHLVWQGIGGFMGLVLTGASLYGLYRIMGARRGRLSRRRERVQCLQVAYPSGL
ncbi:hypothetical protein C922_03599 [Plasmodium inui San Antonio 1]|uniref:Uncharacterized protein n=1 Tax=Plasmodium inui San Antonio 1 TaxID=1237626 RepID=W7A2F9_9APIC|nr:hypothetical protein C922_03599 [Plasmodium inui San Antonio 1]EUD65875.1 hypothetical protein C922_03599 [Plasmodium inui San Antonio 1]